MESKIRNGGKDFAFIMVLIGKGFPASAFVLSPGSPYEGRF
jgi:hypothetical protein